MQYVFATLGTYMYADVLGNIGLMSLTTALSIYGTFNLTRRIGQTIGNSAAVLVLGWVGYDASLAV